MCLFLIFEMFFSLWYTTNINIPNKIFSIRLYGVSNQLGDFTHWLHTSVLLILRDYWFVIAFFFEGFTDFASVHDLIRQLASKSDITNVLTDYMSIRTTDFICFFPSWKCLWPDLNIRSVIVCMMKYSTQVYNKYNTCHR